MTTKTINQQRLDELTEWCRNRPEDAAMRIMVAEGVCGTLGENKHGLKVGDRVVCTEGHGDQFEIETGSEWVVCEAHESLVILSGRGGVKVWADPEKLEKAGKKPKRLEDVEEEFIGCEIRLVDPHTPSR